MKSLISFAMNATLVFGVATYAHVTFADTVELEQKTLETIQEEVECLAKNIYFETHARSLADSMAVSDVVMNRVEDDRYPDTICDVVYQGPKHANGAMKRHQCMFSWYCDGKSDNPRDKKSWERAVKYAVDFYVDGQYRHITEGSTHYHAHYVNPYWTRSKDITKVARIGVHQFYRWEN